MHECVCMAKRTPLAKVEMMTESQRKVSLALTLKAPAGLFHVFPWEVGFEVSVVNCKV